MARSVVAGRRARPDEDPFEGVRRIPREAALRELTRRVERYERLYEIPSEEMLAALRRGERQETADVAQWMVWYRTLVDLSR